KLGAAYWWQNSRLAYASMCSSGDFDLIKPFFRFYIDDIYPANKYRTKKYFGIDGAYFLEMYSPWGGSPMGIYGWDKPMEERKDPLQINRFHKWEWVCGPELVFMMLEYYAHTGDEEFLQEIIPIGKDVASFFKGHYKLDEKGIMHMYPSQALESWWECTNPMPEVSALHAMTDQFVELSLKLSPEDRTFWSEFKKIIPALPIRDTESGKALAPAEKFADRRNIESPEMSAVFPFRQIAIGKPNLELGINALDHQWDSGHKGWHRDDIFMAYLGLADRAQEGLTKRANLHNRRYRFPAMWGPNYDWLPDQTHGGVLTKAAQSMLMQTDGREIHLLPAWPKNWDANFKLHAPYGTIVEATVKDGEIIDLKVTPESRKKDVIIHAAQD
ncbi:MAG: hypothetical protein OES84_05545, partial [Kiritimatiellaceae bacterium]|nr:hypothetical protein [Kiritimatiellaceae bacterium]